jgi:hypothetical protein
LIERLAYLRRRALAGRQLAILLAVAVLAGALAGAAQTLVLWLLMGVTLMTCLAAIAWPGDRSGPLSFMAAFAMFFIIGYVIRAVSLLSGGSHHVFPAWSLPDPDLAQLMRLGLAAAAASVLTVYASYRLAPQWKRGARVISNMSNDVFESAFLWPIVGTLVLVSVVGIGAYFALIAGPLELLEQGPNITTEASFGKYFITVLVNVGVMAQQLLVIRWWGYARRQARVAAAALLLTVGLVGFALLAGSKTMLLELGLCFVIAYHFYSHRLRIWHVLAGALLFASTFPIFSLSREVGLQGITPARIQTAYSEPLEVLSAALGREYNLDSTILAIGWLQQGNDLLYGSSLATVPTFLVPRAIWPDKPITFSIEFNQLVGQGGVYGPFVFVSPSIVGELLMDGHIIGLLLGSIGVGVLMRAVSSALLPGDKPVALAMAMYGPLLVHFAQFVEGPLATHLEFALIDLGTFGTVVFLAVAARRFAAPSTTSLRGLSQATPLHPRA